MSKNAQKLIPLFIFGGLLFPVLMVLAQSDGSIPPEEKPSSTPPEVVETVTVAPPEESTPTETPTPSPATTTSVSTATPEEAGIRPTTSSPATPLTATPTPSDSVLETTGIPIITEQTSNPLNEESTNPLLWVALGALAILPFGYLVAQSLRKKRVTNEDDSDNRCFNIKKLLDEKLEELTDLKGQL